MNIVVVVAIQHVVVVVVLLYSMLLLLLLLGLGLLGFLFSSDFQITKTFPFRNRS